MNDPIAASVHLVQGKHIIQSRYIEKTTTLIEVLSIYRKSMLVLETYEGLHISSGARYPPSPPYRASSP